MLLEFTMCGSAEHKCNPYDVVSDIVRHKLLLLISVKPQDIHSISRELKLSVEEVTKHIRELQRCGLIIEENSLYKPAFAIFTRKDLKKLQPIISRLVTIIIECVKEYIDHVHQVINKLTVVKRV